MGGGDAFSAHSYFMHNPSLSGRGSALKKQRTPTLVLDKDRTPWAVVEDGDRGDESPAAAEADAGVGSTG
jgi:hypothetical protein